MEKEKNTERIVVFTKIGDSQVFIASSDDYEKMDNGIKLVISDKESSNLNRIKTLSTPFTVLEESFDQFGFRTGEEEYEVEVSGINLERKPNETKSVLTIFCKKVSTTTN